MSFFLTILPISFVMAWLLGDSDFHPKPEKGRLKIFLWWLRATPRDRRVADAKAANAFCKKAFAENSQEDAITIIMRHEAPSDDFLSAARQYIEWVRTGDNLP